MLNIENLRAGYDEIEVLHGIDLKVEQQEIVAVIGANASGKTTMLSCISGCLRPSSGKISFLGNDISYATTDFIVDLGLIQVPEGRLLFPKLTVKENLEMGAFSKRSRMDRKAMMKFVFQILPKLEERQNQIAGSLSGGEAQMCAIARGLMAKPKMLMLDEPSLGLAPIIVLDVMKLVKNIRDQDGATVLLVEQNVKQSLKTADRAYVLENGRVAVEGKSHELSDSENVRKAYLGI